MAGNPRVSTELLIPKRWNYTSDHQMITSPDRSRVWIEPKSKTTTTTTTTTATTTMMKKVGVLYYLSRNGHLDHPHLIEVPLIPSSSSQGLYLKDVMNSLNLHRGKGMANMYSWSSKRSYKNGYVWHDLSEDDLIHPTNGHDYILKGTKLLQTSPPGFKSHESNSTQTPPETNTSSGDDCNSSTAITRPRRNQSWSSFDNPQEYVVYKCESSRDLAAKFAADAATQTTEEKRGRRSVKKESVGQSVELSREEMVSPPQLNSSEDGSDGVSGLREVGRGDIRDRTAEGRHPTGRMKASKVLMQLISCGTVSVKGVGTRSKEEWTFDERKC